MTMLFIPERCDEGCSDCITACHTNHNVPTLLTNKRHTIKWIWHAGDKEAEEKGTEFEHAFPEHAENELLAERMQGEPFLVLCNHCANPACVRVCPTQATFRRKDGVVLMDYHRCIGCRFCVAACPYGARSFNFEKPQHGFPDGKAPNPNFPARTKGVVEKCNFCSERDIHGALTGSPELPYCVEACIKRKDSHEESALVFGDVLNQNSTIYKVYDHLTKEKRMVPLRRKEIAGTHPKVYYLV